MTRALEIQEPPLEVSKDGPEFRWLPGADNCRNFFERFTFCPKNAILRAKYDLEESQGTEYRHPLALAYEFQQLLEAGVVNNRAEIARRYGLSRARVTQVMNLLKLPKGVQDYLVALPTEKQRLYSGRRLREIVGIHNEAPQGKAFEELVKKLPGSAGV